MVIYQGSQRHRWLCSNDLVDNQTAYMRGSRRRLCTCQPCVHSLRARATRCALWLDAVVSMPPIVVYPSRRAISRHRGVACRQRVRGARLPLLHPCSRRGRLLRISASLSPPRACRRFTPRLPLPPQRGCCRPLLIPLIFASRFAWPSLWEIGPRFGANTLDVRVKEARPEVKTHPTHHGETI